MAAGVDDPLRPRSDADEVAGHLEAMFAALTAQGTRLATLTFPDVTPITPLARPVRHRVTALNHRVRAAAHRHGGDVAETGATPSSPIPGCGARTACAPVPSATSASPPSPEDRPRRRASPPRATGRRARAADVTATGRHGAGTRCRGGRRRRFRWQAVPRGQRRTRGMPRPIHEMISRWISLLPPPKVKMTAER